MTGFDRFDIVGCGESSRPVEGEEIVQPAREEFSQAVIGKSTAEVKAYWQTVIFSGRGVPPMEAPSEQAVVQFVRTTPGAIGYVSATTPLAQGVRAVRVR